MGPRRRIEVGYRADARRRANAIEQPSGSTQQDRLKLINRARFCSVGELGVGRIGDLSYRLFARQLAQ